MVAHNGSAYLPTVLRALAAQTRPATAILAADAGSTDDSGELLRKELGERNVIPFDPRKGGYGAAVKAVLEHQNRNLGGHRNTPARAASHASATSTPPSKYDAAAPDSAVEPLEPSPAGQAGQAAAAGKATAGKATAQLSREPFPDEAGDSASRHEWIWLLQDDAAPAPDALQLLLETVERSTTAAVAGCKQLDWDNRRRLVDVGLKASRWFDRYALVNLDELDQGQYDDRADFFAVNAAGMLVRRDLWEKLGGFDPAIPGPGDDLDFCARVRLAGFRVLVVPAARVFHVVNRTNPMGSPVAARKAAVFTRLKHAPAWQLPFLVVGAVVSAIYWLFAGFLLKAPGHAVSMFGATLAGLCRPVALVRSRSALARTRVQPRSAHKNLVVGRVEARNQLKGLREAVGPDDDGEPGGPGAPSILEPTGDTHHDAVTPMVAGRTAPAVSALLLAAALAVLSLVVLSRLMGTTGITGGSLLPVSARLGTIWQHATDWWVSLGTGLPGRGNPFNYVVWLLGVLGGGDANAATLWTVLLAIPLSALTAWLAAGAFSRSRWPRVVAALVWAGAPVLLVSLGQGRLGALLAHLLIPLVVLGMVRAVGGARSAGPGSGAGPAGGAIAGAQAASRGASRVASSARTLKLGRPGVDGTPSWTASAAAGLALAAVTAGAPTVFPIAVVAVLLATVFLGRRGRTLWWSLLPTLAVFLPFVWSAQANPRALLGDPGVPLAGNPGPLWEQLLGFPNAVTPVHELLGAGIPVGGTTWTWVAAFVVGGPVVLAAFLALLAPIRRAGTVRTMWLVALLALAVSYGSKLIAVGQDGTSLVTPFNGPAVSVALFALLAAALLGFDAVYRRAYQAADRGAKARGGSRATAAVLSVLLVAAPVASLGLWTVNNFNGNGAGLAGASALVPVQAGTIPATAADRGTGPEASRTIVLRADPSGNVQATLMQGAGTTLDSLSTIAAARNISGEPGREKVAGPDAATSVLRETVAVLMARSGVDPRPELMSMGVGFVVLQNGDTAAQLVASQLDAVPGLNAVGPTDSGWLWRVNPTYQKAGPTEVVNRVRLVDAKGAALSPVESKGVGVDTAVAAGPAGRRVVLAERFDAGWQATLDGTALAPVQDGWAQAFELPAAGGHLEIHFVQPWNALMSLAQLVLLGLTVLLAIPVRARRGRTGAYRDEASLHKVGRGV